MCVCFYIDLACLAVAGVECRQNRAIRRAHRRRSTYEPFRGVERSLERVELSDLHNASLRADHTIGTRHDHVTKAPPEESRSIFSRLFSATSNSPPIPMQ